MSLSLSLSPTVLVTLDLSPAHQVIEPIATNQAWLANEQTLTFNIEYPRAPSDPREFSEIPEVRLWFVRLDAQYPWLPFLLDWKGGELARYAAMLIPHQFHPTDGIQYNPEALEIFIMAKVFILMDWLPRQGIEGKSRIQSMAQMMGYELSDNFFQAIQ
jgi:hypothetical protein